MQDFWNTGLEVVDAASKISDELKQKAHAIVDPTLPPGCYMMSGSTAYYDNGLHDGNSDSHKYFGDGGCGDYRFAADFLREYLQYCIVNGLKG